MGAVRMRVQTTYENITVIHNLDSSPSINVLQSEKLHVYNKQIHH